MWKKTIRFLGSERFVSFMRLRIRPRGKHNECVRGARDII
jgi:hypothetical protein